MTTQHVDLMLAELRIGTEGLDLGPILLSDFDISSADVSAIAASWSLAPMDSYCPCSDIPFDAIKRTAQGWGTGVHQISNTELWVVGDNGMCAFGFKFTRPSEDA